MSFEDELALMHADCNAHYGQPATLAVGAVGAFNNATLKNDTTTQSQAVTIVHEPVRRSRIANTDAAEFGARVIAADITIGDGVPKRGWTLTLPAKGDLAERAYEVVGVEMLANRTEYRLICQSTASKAGTGGS